MGKSLSTHHNSMKKTREMEKSTEVFPLEKVPDLVLLCIVNHLQDEDARHLSLTCQRFRKILPNYPHIINGPDVNESGPYDGHFVPTKYFQSPVLEDSVERIEMSMAWWDQGYGNRKGQVWLKLYRPKKNKQAKLITEMNPHRFGIAPHQKPPKMSKGKWEGGKGEESMVVYDAGRGCLGYPRNLKIPPPSLVLNGIEFENNAEEVLIQTDEIVKLAQPGDYFEIMKNVGGGGGHHLWIQNFKLKVYYTKHF